VPYLPRVPCLPPHAAEHTTVAAAGHGRFFTAAAFWFWRTPTTPTTPSLMPAAGPNKRRSPINCRRWYPPRIQDAPPHHPFLMGRQVGDFTLWRYCYPFSAIPLNPALGTFHQFGLMACDIQNFAWNSRFRTVGIPTPALEGLLTFWNAVVFLDSNPHPPLPAPARLQACSVTADLGGGSLFWVRSLLEPHTLWCRHSHFTR